MSVSIEKGISRNTRLSFIRDDWQEEGLGEEEFDPADFILLEDGTFILLEDGSGGLVI